MEGMGEFLVENLWICHHLLHIDGACQLLNLLLFLSGAGDNLHGPHSHQPLPNLPHLQLILSPLQSALQVPQFLKQHSHRGGGQRSERINPARLIVQF